MKALTLLLDGCHGIYIPKLFSEHYPECVTEGDIEILSDIDNPEYWDTWDKILQTFKYVDWKRNNFYLWHDEDLWLYCPDLMTGDEYYNFFGEKKCG